MPSLSTQEQNLANTCLSLSIQRISQQFLYNSESCNAAIIARLTLAWTFLINHGRQYNPCTVCLAHQYSTTGQSIARNRALAGSWPLSRGDGVSRLLRCAFVLLSESNVGNHRTSARLIREAVAMMRLHTSDQDQSSVHRTGLWYKHTCLREYSECVNSSQLSR